MARLKKPSIIVNFKTYEQGSGKSAELLAKKFSKISRGNVMLAVQNADIRRISKVARVPVYAQHVDPSGSGQFTGKDIAKTLRYNGASGVLINHSEDRAKPDQIKDTINICRKAGLTTVVCISRPSLAKSVAKMGPDMIAIEPPELIGTGIAVSKAKPHVVTRSVDAVKKVNKSIDVLCGAGIWTKNDVRKAVRLGCRGVLVASAIMTAKKPEKIVKEFLDALK